MHVLKLSCLVSGVYFFDMIDRNEPHVLEGHINEICRTASRTLFDVARVICLLIPRPAAYSRQGQRQRALYTLPNPTESVPISFDEGSSMT